MAVEIGTALSHQDLFDKLRTFLTTAVGVGQNWTELDYDAGNRTMILQAPGLAGTDEIHVGFGIAESVGTDSYALRGWMFRAYNPLLGHEGQPGHSGSYFHPVWNVAIPYWFIASGRRVIIVTKISTVYTASYLGMFLPYGVPGEYPQPYYLGMPSVSNTRWSSTNQTFRNFFDPCHESARILLPTVSWWPVGNFLGTGGESQSFTDGFIWPYAAYIGADNGSTTNRYRILRQAVDGSYPIVPTVLCANNPSPDIFGELDGVHAVTGFGTASEDTVTVGADDYLVVQNTFRTERYYYAAIKLA